MTSAWMSCLSRSIVTVLLKAYIAKFSRGGRISLYQLHRPYKSRVHCRKVCPLHGEATGDKVVTGFEDPRGQHVAIEPAEIKQMEAAAVKSLTVDSTCAGSPH